MRIDPNTLAACLKAAHKAVNDTFSKLTPEQRKRIADNIIKQARLKK